MPTRGPPYIFVLRRNFNKLHRGIKKAARKADVNGCLDFIPRQHPRFDAGTRQVVNGAWNTLLKRGVGDMLMAGCAQTLFSGSQQQ